MIWLKIGISRFRELSSDSAGYSEEISYPRGNFRRVLGEGTMLKGVWRAGSRVETTHSLDANFQLLRNSLYLVSGVDTLDLNALQNIRDLIYLLESVFSRA